jgi:hypothetical protein
MAEKYEPLDKEIATLLKKSIVIVDELAKFGTVDGYNYTNEEVQDLIDRAEKLSKHRLWKLK